MQDCPPAFQYSFGKTRPALSPEEGTMITLVLIVHLLVAVALLGAITHQTLSLFWAPAPLAAPAGQVPFFRNYRAVRANVYTNMIVIMFVIVALFGSLLYPDYRLTVLPFMRTHHATAWGGVFELKEHIVAIGLGLLPLYWYLWKKVLLSEHVQIRKIITAIIFFCVWWSFLDGHLINNIKGFGP
jgi:hypothetical protein